MKTSKRSVVFDIRHYPSVNLFKNAIKALMENDIDVHVIIRPRGNLVSLFQEECPTVSYTLIGQHKKTLFGKMIDMIYRDIAFLRYLSSIDFDLGVDSINLAHTTKLFGKPTVEFVDDTEYKLAYTLIKLSAKWVIMPRCIPAKGKNILKFNGFKELAYLHPNHFTPDKKALEEFDLKPYEYVFMREVSSASLNYRKLEMGRLSKILDYIKERNLKILLSIEDKSLVDLFENHCIILNEPVEDIYSLLHFASFTLSSGDSMARESCLAGTPAIYTGGRNMAINDELIRRSFMFKAEDAESIKKTIDYVISHDIKKEVEAKIKFAIEHEWEDTTQVILDVLLGIIYKDKSLIEKYKSDQKDNFSKKEEGAQKNV
jgi:predicted glycosyltransferase